MTTTAPPSSSPHHAPKQSQKVGLGPGSLVHIGERRMDEPKVTCIEYDDEVISVRELKDLKEANPQCRAYDKRNTVVWINVDGVHEAKFIDELGKRFGLHPLVLEDVMNVGQRPKLEEYDDCLFCVLKMLDVDNNDCVMMEQVSLVLGKGFVLTFQERDGDVFEGVRERIKNHKGKIRKMGADYLAYALIDAIVDNYFIALDTMSELVDDLEHRLQERPEKVDAKEIYMLKRETLFLRRSIYPAREVLGQLSRHEEEEQLISAAVDVYFRDVHDHVLQVTDSLETTREMIVSLLEMYHSVQGNRLNEVMRILTVISTIFIPLTFIAGIYGMNFDNMPELHKDYGYFACLGVMFVVGIGMLAYVKKNRWL